MITKEEFENVKIGDYIQIVDRWNEYTDENPDGKMDYLLGRTFEVTERASKTTVEKSHGILMIKSRDNTNASYWYLNEFCIAKVIKRTENLKSIDDASLEKMLEDLSK